MSKRMSKDKTSDDGKDDKKKRVSLTGFKDAVESAKKHVRRLSNVSRGSKSSSRRSSLAKVFKQEENSSKILST